MSFVGPPWPAQTIRIAGAASYCVTLAVGQSIATPPAAESGLNRPRLKEELRPVGANVRVVGIWRREKLDRPPRRFPRMLGQPSLALHDPLRNLALGHALACHSIAISPLPKRFLHRYPYERRGARRVDARAVGRNEGREKYRQTPEPSLSLSCFLLHSHAFG